jgi:hypothetical protein
VFRLTKWLFPEVSDCSQKVVQAFQAVQALAKACGYLQGLEEWENSLTAAMVASISASPNPGCKGRVNNSS